jgi:hypothetical protein
MPDPVTAITAGASAIGGIANIFGSQSAAQAQQQAAQQANATILQQQQQGLTAQKNYFNQTTGPLSGIAGQGATAYSNLNAAIPGLTAPINMDEATLQNTPGYQFNLLQGERGIGLGAAATGLSGGQAKAAAQFATGLADSTYQNQFNNANTNKNNAFNFLLNTANTGAQAASAFGQVGAYAGNADVTNSATVGGQLGGNLVGAGNAQGAANVATGANVGNAFSGIAGATNNYLKNNSSQNPFGNYGTLAQANPGANGSAYYGPVAPPSMYGS